MKKYVQTICAFNVVNIAVILTLFVTLLSAFTAFQLILKIPLVYPLSMFAGLTLPLYFVFFKKAINIKEYLWSICIFILCSLLSAFIFDFSWDGQAYHELAQIVFAGGWNPYWDPEQIGRYQNDIWVNAYPKGLWFYAVCFYQITGNILVGKSFYLLLVISDFLLSYEILLQDFLKKKFLSIIFALVFTFTPVVIVQFLTYYIDAAVYLLFFGIILLTYLACKKTQEGGAVSIALCGTIILLCNTKFTGAAYAVIICITESARLLAKKDYANFKKVFAIYSVGGILGIFVVGFNPYVTNITRHHNVGWPIMGDHKIDIVNTQISPEFAKHNRFVKFVWGYNSYGFNDKVNLPKLKIPGTIKKSDLTVMQLPDARIGGFGPIFDIQLLFALIAFIWLFSTKRLNKDQIILIIGIICSIFINPECWWARYVPQLYLVTILILLYFTQAYRSKIELWTVKLFGAVVLINLVPSSGYSLMKNLKNQYLENVLEKKLKKQYIQSGCEFYVNFKDYYSRTASMLDRNNIKYKVIDEAKICVPAGYKKIFEDSHGYIYCKVPK